MESSSWEYSVRLLDHALDRWSCEVRYLTRDYDRLDALTTDGFYGGWLHDIQRLWTLDDRWQSRHKWLREQDGLERYASTRLDMISRFYDSDDEVMGPLM